MKYFLKRLHRFLHHFFHLFFGTFLKNHSFVPQVLKQVVNLSCFLMQLATILLASLVGGLIRVQ